MKPIVHSINLAGLILLLILTGCNQKPDFEQLEAEIRELHNATIEAHLKKDVAFFTKDLGENYFSVGRGEIMQPSKTEITDMFSHYFSTTDFKVYEDLQDPLIGFSSDGSLAWSVVRVRVAGDQHVHPDSLRTFDTTWAWITLYKRDHDGWIRLGEVSSSN